MQQILSDRALALYALLNQEYIRTGYRCSGRVSLGVAASRLGSSQEAVHGALRELVVPGLAQQRDCEKECGELSALARYRLLVEHGLSKQWERQAPHFDPAGADGEVEQVVDEVTQLCHELAGKLIQVRTVPLLATPGRESYLVVFPLHERRAHQLLGPVDDSASSGHALEVFRVYAAEKLLDALRWAPVTRFADEAATRFIRVTLLDSTPQWGWRAARWIVTCLFAPQEDWIDRPCIARATPVSQDPDGNKTRAAAEKWRAYIASVIRCGMREHLGACDRGQGTLHSDGVVGGPQSSPARTIGGSVR